VLSPDQLFKGLALKGPRFCSWKAQRRHGDHTHLIGDSQDLLQPGFIEVANPAGTEPFVGGRQNFESNPIKGSTRRQVPR
jgi:hypothetical protein